MTRAAFKMKWQLLFLWLLSSTNFSLATTYYVSPNGNDAADGRFAASAWKSCKQVEHAKLEPGDSILFQRDGEWRERLEATADGTAGKPIVYDAYGEGAKPTFFGSDLLPNADFKPVATNQYACRVASPADSTLANRMFIPSTFTDRHDHDHHELRPANRWEDLHRLHAWECAI